MSIEAKKACELSQRILDQINDYMGKYVGMNGKDVVTDSSLMELQEILEEGFALHNFVVEKKLYEGKPRLISATVELEKFMNQLQINKENAEKLRLSNAIQIWNQTKIAVAVLANTILDEFEEKEE